jgi:hypothetical protein
MGNAKAPSHKSTVSKDLFQSPGFSIGGNVIIVSFPPQQKVAHSTATEVGEMSGAMKAVEDLENLLAHLGPGDWVLITIDDIGLHWFQLTDSEPIPCIMIFSGKIKVIGLDRKGWQIYLTRSLD